MDGGGPVTSNYRVRVDLEVEVQRGDGNGEPEADSLVPIMEGD